MFVSCEKIEVISLSFLETLSPNICRSATAMHNSFAELLVFSEIEFLSVKTVWYEYIDQSLRLKKKTVVSCIAFVFESLFLTHVLVQIFSTSNYYR